MLVLIEVVTHVRAAAGEAAAGEVAAWAVLASAVRRVGGDAAAAAGSSRGRADGAWMDSRSEAEAEAERAGGGRERDSSRSTALGLARWIYPNRGQRGMDVQGPLSLQLRPPPLGQ